MKERTIAAQAAALLAGLGETPDEIAAMLLGAGYKGVQEDPTGCPCGACLSDHLGETIFVYSSHVTDTWFSQDNAPHVSDLIKAFDAGKYPELVRRP